jgi:hypothetical protein
MAARPASFRQRAKDYCDGHMPYEISFTKHVALLERAEYINDCCVGGDAVIDRLLPAIKARYSSIQSNQEDWGWFIWFANGHISFAVDVFTDNPDEGLFRIHLTSRTKTLKLFQRIVDTSELEDLLGVVESELQAWPVDAIRIVHLDRNYM